MLPIIYEINSFKLTSFAKFKPVQFDQFEQLELNVCFHRVSYEIEIIILHTFTTLLLFYENMYLPNEKIL